MDDILRIKHLAKYLGISRSTIYNLYNEKSKYYKADFPKPIKLSLRARGWRRSEIDLYLASASCKENELKKQNQ